jgi:hypothetical protein
MPSLCAKAAAADCPVPLPALLGVAELLLELEPELLLEPLPVPAILEEPLSLSALSTVTPPHAPRHRQAAMTAARSSVRDSG